MVYKNDETFIVPVELANFDPAIHTSVAPEWTIKDNGRVLFKGQLPATSITTGNAISLGTISQSLAAVREPKKMVLTIRVGKYENEWDFFVYPASLPSTSSGIYVCQNLDEKAIATLNDGGKVLLTFPKNAIGRNKGRDIAIGFSSIFWNTAWTNGQAPHTLGILCNPSHPAFRHFPTDYYSNWQWWDAISHSNAVILDSVTKGLKPIVRVIDDWVTNRSLGLIFECRVGNGKLLVSSIDLVHEQEMRPEARQLLFTLRKYMETSAFDPQTSVDLKQIKRLTD